MAATAEIITLAEAPAGCDVRVRPVVALATTDPAVVIWPCERCWDENGRISMYAHVAGGVCFKCHGYGGTDMGLAQAQARAAKLLKGRIARARKAERERLAKLAARDGKIAALVAEHPGLAELLDDAVGGYARAAEPGEDADASGWDYDAQQEYPMVVVKPLGDFVYAMAETLRYQPERMTAKRCAAAVEAIAKERAKAAAHQAKLAAAGEVPTGRVEISGTIVAVWEKEVQAGPYSTTWTVKMRVETVDGWVGIGTAPRALLDVVCEPREATWRDLRGKAVVFTATVEPAGEQRDGELPVGWLARPAKARLA